MFILVCRRSPLKWSAIILLKEAITATSTQSTVRCTVDQGPSPSMQIAPSPSSDTSLSLVEIHCSAGSLAGLLEYIARKDLLTNTYYHVIIVRPVRHLE